MKRRRIAFVSLAAACALALAAACTISSIEFAPGAGEDGATPPSTNDGGNTGDAIYDANVVPSDASEAAVAEGGRIDASGSCTAYCVGGNCCDCDGDGYERAEAGCDAALPDCDDLSRDIHPDAGFTQGLWPNSDWTPQFDWDCNKTPEREFKTDYTKCSGGCGQEGFKGDPGCSQTAPYFSCAANVGGLLGCTESFAPATQACK